MSLPRSNFRRLLKEDLDKPCNQLSIYLLGKILVRKLEDNTLLKGRIVETESYLGGDDKGSHSYNGRRSEANEPMYLPAGTTYVYLTYGMHNCFNISSRESGAAVLLRALEPISGVETMQQFRAHKMKNSKGEMKISKLCNGPAKLCISMNITKQSLNKVDLTDPNNDKLWLEDDHDINKKFKIVHTSRIGITSAGVEWSIKPLRYYILHNSCVSKRDKAAEDDLYFDIG